MKLFRLRVFFIKYFIYFSRYSSQDNVKISTKGTLLIFSVNLIIYMYNYTTNSLFQKKEIGLFIKCNSSIIVKGNELSDYAKQMEFGYIYNDVCHRRFLQTAALLLLSNLVTC